MGMIYGGRTNYGQPVGILMLDTVFPRIPGDVGNAFTFDFPVRYLKVEGANPARVVIDADPALLDPFICAARQLESEGCRLISTSCGFLVMFQQQLAAAVSVPVLTSSLLMVPLLQRTLGPDKKVGVITARKCSLNERHFAGAGITDMDVPLVGLEHEKAFPPPYSFNGLELDVDAVKEEMARAGETMAKEHPEVGAIVLECTNMPPYAALVREASGLPVFDITHLLRFAAMGLLDGNALWARM